MCRRLSKLKPNVHSWNKMGWSMARSLKIPIPYFLVVKRSTDIYSAKLTSLKKYL